MGKSFPDWPIWKQFYHTLHSLDEWFIDPVTFKEPSIHQPYFRTSDTGPGRLTKEQLLKYFGEIRSKIENYLAQLSVAQLEEPVGKGNLTRLDLILSQFRHVMHHVGYLHCAIKSETGEAAEIYWPKAAVSHLSCISAFTPSRMPIRAVEKQDRFLAL